MANHILLDCVRSLGPASGSVSTWPVRPHSGPWLLSLGLVADFKSLSVGASSQGFRFLSPYRLLAAVEGAELQGVRLLSFVGFDGSGLHSAGRPYLVCAGVTSFGDWGPIGSVVGLRLHSSSYRSSIQF